MLVSHDAAQIIALYENFMTNLTFPVRGCKAHNNLMVIADLDPPTD